MPTWTVVLTVCFSGIVAGIIIINFFRSATKDRIDRLETYVHEMNNRLESKLEAINRRIDRHLEGHS